MAVSILSLGQDESGARKFTMTARLEICGRVLQNLLIFCGHGRVVKFRAPSFGGVYVGCIEGLQGRMIPRSREYRVCIGFGYTRRKFGDFLVLSKLERYVGCIEGLQGRMMPRNGWYGLSIGTGYIGRKNGRFSRSSNDFLIYFRWFYQHFQWKARVLLVFRTKGKLLLVV